MKLGLHVTLAALLAFSADASAYLAKRDATEYVKDGGFEAVRPRSLNLHDARSGNWQVKGGASFSNNKYDVQTIYGQQYVQWIFGTTQTILKGSVSQEVKGPLPSGTFQLSYAFQTYNPYHLACSLNVTYGSQLVDSMALLPTDSSDWLVRNASFVPEESSGLLEFDLACPRHIIKTNYGFYLLDEVSLSGPS